MTAAHAHLAFYGAYVMLNLAIITYAMPSLRGLMPYNQVLNMWSFWMMTSAMAFMTFTLTFAGVVQTHMQRVVGGYSLHGRAGPARPCSTGCAWAPAWCVLIGAAVFVYAVLGPVREQLTAASGVRRPAPAE